MFSHGYCSHPGTEAAVTKKYYSILFTENPQLIEEISSPPLLESFSWLIYENFLNQTST